MLSKTERCYLINQCVQKMISKVIGQFDSIYKGLDMKPLDKLKYLIKSTSTFLALQPGISRISILNDLTAGSPGDNSIQTINAYYPVMKEACGDKKTDDELFILLHMLISSVQVAFLRRDVLKKMNNIDFNRKEQRDAFIDKLVDSLLTF